MQLANRQSAIPELHTSCYLHRSCLPAELAGFALTPCLQPVLNCCPFIVLFVHSASIGLNSIIGPRPVDVTAICSV